ncbi:MobH family relaxase [Shewanella aestuarii]|uniref:Uncharacterized domain-containing protein n=1 Tax=Shewanella aestuarii TaxID=1028752 RepID=A0A6G9QPC1_9GAMM|nr:MobH family relaxase [Shewanella aestuarii]QIR16434.1 hypothetical protein HBH39_18350 [Shewanella aestuarii]
MLKVMMWSKKVSDNFRDIIGNLNKKDHIEALRVDEEKLDALLHYPIKPSAIPLVSIESLYRRHKEKIRYIERDIPLVKVGSEFNTTDMVEAVIKNFIAYCHLLPASEMDHHRYIGGLLEHSLDVSIRALQVAMGATLDEEREIDLDQKRKPRYEYAAWLCGLLHDAGKIISNMTVYDPKSDKQWQPLNSNLYDWAKIEGISEYSVSHNKNRIHNEHETNSIHFLSFVISDSAKKYLIGDGDGSDDLYSKITQTLIGYHSNKGYLYNAVRKADGASTYADYARVWLHDSHRDKSMVSAVVDVLRTLYFEWTTNKPTSEVFFLNGEVYLEMTKPFKDVIAKCRELKIPVPSSPKTLIEILIDKRIIGKVSDKSTFGNLYVGNFTEQDIHQFSQDRTGPMASTSPKAVVKFVWVNFIIGDNPIPDDAQGALRYNSVKSENTHTLFGRNTSKIIYPISTETKANEPVSEEVSQSTSQIESDSNVDKNQIKIDTNKPMPAPAKMKVGKSATKVNKTSNPPESKAKSSNKNDVDETIVQQSIDKSNEDINQQKSESESTDKAKVTKKKKASKSVKKKLDNNVEASNEEPKSPAIQNELPIVEVEQSKPAWVGKRVIKQIDLVLLELHTTQNTSVVTLIGADVAVSLEYLANACSQSSKEVIKEAEYLAITKSSKTLPKKVEINGQLQKIIVLNDVVATEFKYLADTSIRAEETTPAQLVNAANGGQTTTVESSTDNNEGKKSEDDSEVIETNQQSNNTSNDLDNHSLPENLDYKVERVDSFLSRLSEEFPSISLVTVRPYLKNLNIHPFIDDDGNLNVKIKSAEEDELIYRIKQGIMND